MIKLNNEIYKNKLSIDFIEEDKFIIKLPHGENIEVRSELENKVSWLSTNNGTFKMKLDFYLDVETIPVAIWYMIPDLGNILIIQSFSSGPSNLGEDVCNVSLIIFEGDIPKSIFSYNSYYAGVTALGINDGKVNLNILKYVDTMGTCTIVSVHEFFLEKNGFVSTNKKGKLYLFDIGEDKLKFYKECEECEVLRKPYANIKELK